MTDLMWLTSQEERDSASIDEQVRAAASRLSAATHYDDLTDAEQEQVRSALRVFDLYCDNCGREERTYLPADAESWTCGACS